MHPYAFINFKNKTFFIESVALRTSMARLGTLFMRVLHKYRTQSNDKYRNCTRRVTIFYFYRMVVFNTIPESLSLSNFNISFI